MEKMKCNACQIEKNITSFYKCKDCKNGVIKICKSCKLKGIKSKRRDDYIHPFNLNFRNDESSQISLANTTKEDYEQMYLVLKNMGYNINGDIHQQFIDKFNLQTDEPMNYKPRKGRPNFYIPDGDKVQKNPYYN